MKYRPLGLAPLSLLLLTISGGWASSAFAAEKVEGAVAFDDPRSGAALNLDAAKRFSASGESLVRRFARFIFAGTVNDPASDATAQDTQSETTVVNLGDSRLVAAFNDSGSFAGGGAHFTGYAYSSNSGASWTDGGTLPDSPEGDAGDPVLVHRTVDDTVFLATLGFNTGENIQVFKSTDAGHTFGPPVNGTPGFAGSGDFQDKEWMAVDNFPGPGNGHIYLCWTRFFSGAEVRFTRSTDGGTTFGPSGGTLISSGGQGCFVVVSPNHSVHVFYYRGTGSSGQGGDNKIFMRRSLDRGVTFQPEVQVADLATTTVNGNLGLNGGLRSNSFPHATVDPTTGRLYVIYNDDPNLASEAADGDIYVARSNNGGATWLPPVKINDDDLAGDQFFPTIAFAADGTAMASWYSRSHDPVNFMFHRRGRLGDPGAGHILWDQSFQLSPDTPIAIGQDPAINTVYMGDYDQISSAGVSFAATWSDNRDGNAFHQFQPDVRFARLLTNPPATNLRISITRAPIPISLGEQTTIRVTALATVGTANDVFVSVPQPPGLIFRSVTSSGDCENINGFISCRLGSILTGGANAKTVEIVAEGAYEAGIRTVTAYGTTTSRDTTPASNKANINVNVQAGSTINHNFSTGNISTPIPDATTIEVPITIPVGGTLVQMVPQIRLNHTFDADLDLTLVSPSGQTIDLSSDNGGSGDNYGSGSTDCAGAKTGFNDLAGTSIRNGVAPFVGTFEPEEPIAEVIGGPVTGTWKLRITDDLSGDVGTLFCFRLLVTRQP